MSTRYSRQELFQPIGTEGQKRLNDSKAVIIGAGALGTASAEMFVRAGVGSVTILDRDYIEWSNLQRQQLYTEQDVKDRLPKAVAAEKRLKQVNSDVYVKGIVIDVTAHNIDELVSGASIIVDAADNFEVRMIANDAAVKHQIPFLYGACVASYGIQFTVIPGETPCLHCLLEHLPAQGMTCDTAGIISPVVQQVAAYQVADALKYLTGHPVTPILKSFDLWKNERSDIRSAASLKKKQCPSCGLKMYPFLSYEKSAKADVLCGRNTVQIRSAAETPPPLHEVAHRLKKAGMDVLENPYLLSCQKDEFKLVLFKDGRALVHGTNDIAKARTIYHQWIG
ncbi:thiazole biosynthesis adenylyltransferase ThiF [Bacillus sp. FSL R5-0439]|uniref:thiazole biosynthesis adenylyltransferase ThiF n=1 Tax=Bacillus sp. FSL R5-0439 TaxID=2954586 RepID=UPI0030FA401B